MSQRLYISEVFAKMETLKTKEEKINLIRKNNTLALRTVLQAAFDSQFQFFNGDAVPPYRPNNAPDVNLAETDLFHAYKQLSVWLTTHPAKQLKKESVLINFLEGMHPKESKVLEGVLCKNLDKQFPSLTEDFVREVYPDLLAPKPKKRGPGRPRKNPAPTSA